MGALEIGDYVATSWGYDQTQVEFFMVVGLTPSGKSARVQQVWARDVATGGNMHRSLVPTHDILEGAPITTHLILDDRGTLKVDGHYAWKHKPGQTHYATGHGYGH